MTRDSGPRITHDGFPWDESGIYKYTYIVYHRNQPFIVGKYTIVPWKVWECYIVGFFGILKIMILNVEDDHLGYSKLPKLPRRLSKLRPISATGIPY